MNPDKEVKLGKVIGKGGFGEVRKGQWRGTQVAVKLIMTTGSNRGGGQPRSIHSQVSLFQHFGRFANIQLPQLMVPLNDKYNILISFSNSQLFSSSFLFKGTFSQWNSTWF